jgi:hypothetical protein
MWTTNFVEERTGDFHVDLCSCAAVAPAVRLEDSDVFCEERIGRIVSILGVVRLCGLSRRFRPR